MPVNSVQSLQAFENRKRTQIRNWRIRMLRGMYANAINLSDLFEDYQRPLILEYIDGALERMGAESESKRRERQRKELENYGKEIDAEIASANIDNHKANESGGSA